MFKGVLYLVSGEGQREAGEENVTITQHKTLLPPWNFAPCYVASWMGREFEGEWIRNGYVWLSPFAVRLKLSQLC